MFFPLSLVWAESYVLMSSQVVSVVCAGMALGELAVPQLLARLTIEAQTWLGFAMLGATFLCIGLFVCILLLARRHSRYTRIPHLGAGYELARQEDLNHELMFDDDDEEDDFEVAEPTLRLAPTTEEESHA